MKKIACSVIIGPVLVTQSATAQNTKPVICEELNRRTGERRAVGAVIWGLPLVSEDAMRQAYFRDGTAKYNDIIGSPKGAGCACD
jgi:hypothetical protein